MKIAGFSYRLGFDNFTLVNKFAYRAKDVTALRWAPDPIGPRNDDCIRFELSRATMVIGAWGPMLKLPAPLRQRWYEILALCQEYDKPIYCFGTAKDGHPRHPLMLGYQTPLEEWTPPR